MIDFSFNLSIRLGMAAGGRIQITTASRSQGCTPGEAEWLVECANRTAVLVYCSQTGMARASRFRLDRFIKAIINKNPYLSYRSRSSDVGKMSTSLDIQMVLLWCLLYDEDTILIVDCILFVSVYDLPGVSEASLFAVLHNDMNVSLIQGNFCNAYKSTRSVP